jgi:hypothetical protein
MEGESKGEEVMSLTMTDKDIESKGDGCVGGVEGEVKGGEEVKEREEGGSEGDGDQEQVEEGELSLYNNIDQTPSLSLYNEEREQEVQTPSVKKEHFQVLKCIGKVYIYMYAFAQFLITILIMNKSSYLEHTNREAMVRYIWSSIEATKMFMP